ncbi:NADH-quinone oxidoreductase subunit J family protein [Rhabdothermincola sediminis]|uniref:NADH-quinone oxidoreductase subunit J family protein n=1 Tax=Rhabdothermincola sediminis TaxID=2751370 RepID=UPI001AA017DC|nr:NADH-quinone oxidoreductase subunit J [Rhabdothermincola sediminis]
MEATIFFVCAVIALAGAFGVVLSRNPVHAALSLVATLFAIAVLFLNQGAQLLAAVQVIVYTGAIVVLILFVLMLLGIDKEEDLRVEPLVGQRTLAFVVAAAIFGALLAVVILGGANVVTGARSVTQPLADGVQMTDIRQIGQQLFSTYVFPLEVTAGLLTVAVVGAVVLARRVRNPQPLPEPEPLDEDEDRLLYAEEGAD